LGARQGCHVFGARVACSCAGRDSGQSFGVCECSDQVCYASHCCCFCLGSRQRLSTLRRAFIVLSVIQRERDTRRDQKCAGEVALHMLSSVHEFGSIKLVISLQRARVPRTHCTKTRPCLNSALRLPSSSCVPANRVYLASWSPGLW
jgi:hypothetical protein